MLVLTRDGGIAPGEQSVFVELPEGGRMEIKVWNKGGKIRMSIDAPPAYRIVRSERLKAAEQEALAAAASAAAAVAAEAVPFVEVG